MLIVCGCAILEVMDSNGPSNTRTPLFMLAVVGAVAMIAAAFYGLRHLTAWLLEHRDAFATTFAVVVVVWAVWVGLAWFKARARPAP